jgi:hypothetical protein
MMPGRLDLTIYSGDDYTLVVRFETPDGDLIDIAGRDYRAQIRPRRESDEVTAFQVVVTDVVTLSLPNTVTLSLKSGVWDLEEIVGGKVTTVLAGGVVVSKDVTR